MTAVSIKVLVIDDEPPIRKLLRMGLTTQGYEILEATNGKNGLALLAENPDVIILDLGLPDIPGLDLLAHDPRAQRSRSRSWCCRAVATRPRRFRRSITAPTTT